VHKYNRREWSLITISAEKYVSHKEPLVLLRLFKNHNYVCLMSVSGVGFMIYYALSSIYPQQAVTVWGKNTTESGWFTVGVTLKTTVLLD
jgi:hypothetical protein